MEAGATVSRDYNRAELRYNWVVIKNEYISYSFQKTLWSIIIYHVEWNIGPYEYFNIFSTLDKKITHNRQTVSEAIVY